MTNFVWSRERETDEFWLARIEKVDRDLAQTTDPNKRERLEDRKKYAVATLGESEPRHRRLRLFDYAKACFEEVGR